jgi:hypothetical protein
MKTKSTRAVVMFLALHNAPTWAESLAVDEPLQPEPQRNVRPVDLLVAERRSELAVDEPLNPNASRNTRPVALLVVDRNHDLFVDDRAIIAPSTPVATNGMGVRTLLFTPSDAVAARTVAGQAASSGELSFDKTAVALDTIEQGRSEARWFATLQTAEGPTRFGELVMTDDHGGIDPRRTTTPLIGRVRGVADAALQITDPAGRGSGWVYVAAGPRAGEIWGVLDAVQGEPNPALTMVHSTDEGRSWTVQPLQKPARQAEFSVMTMDAAGRGTLVLYLPQEQGGLQPGFYPFTTSDAGQAWIAQPGRNDLPPMSNDASGMLRDALEPQQVSATLYGGSGWFRCYRPIFRPYGSLPTRPPSWRPDPAVTPAPEVTGRLKALENPGFDDHMERGKVPARFDISPKQER